MSRRRRRRTKIIIISAVRNGVGYRTDLRWVGSHRIPRGWIQRPHISVGVHIRMCAAHLAGGVDWYLAGQIRIPMEPARRKQHVM